MKRLSFDNQEATNEASLLGYMGKSAKHFTDVAGFFSFEITKMGD
jgi:hypothetical protein